MSDLLGLSRKCKVHSIFFFFYFILPHNKHFFFTSKDAKFNIIYNPLNHIFNHSKQRFRGLLLQNHLRHHQTSTFASFIFKVCSIFWGFVCFLCELLRAAEWIFALFPHYLPCVLALLILDIPLIPLLVPFLIVLTCVCLFFLLKSVPSCSMVCGSSSIPKRSCCCCCALKEGFLHLAFHKP